MNNKGMWSNREWHYVSTSESDAHHTPFSQRLNQQVNATRIIVVALKHIQMKPVESGQIIVDFRYVTYSFLAISHLRKATGTTPMGVKSPNE